ncbi:hypothetical protein THICB3560287 [Thiomonas sp. CB3]|nr:hypothetical protein THICB3560287 [Thiomonas sp. CB3]
MRAVLVICIHLLLRNQVSLRCTGSHVALLVGNDRHYVCENDDAGRLKITSFTARGLNE